MKNFEDAKKILFEHINALEKELLYNNQELAKAISIEKLIEQGLLFSDYEANEDKLARRAKLELVENTNSKEKNNITEVSSTKKNTVKNRLEEQKNLVEYLEYNIVDLEIRLAKAKSRYDRFYNWSEEEPPTRNDGGEDNPPTGGLAPSPRPNDPPPNFNINDAAFPDE